MSMLRDSFHSLWHHTGSGHTRVGRTIQSVRAAVTLNDLTTRSSFGPALDTLRGRSVLVATKNQLSTAIAMIELDGVAARLVLCPPDTFERHASAILQAASIDAAVSDHAMHGQVARHVAHTVTCEPDLSHAAVLRPDVTNTEWILLTSGTTGAPKLVVHTLSSLLGPIDNSRSPTIAPVWSTFYDIRRYGGLQIILRALTGGGSMVLSSVEESPEAYLLRTATAGVSHISGTPSHWRRAAMGSLGNDTVPEYIRLSGEIADQPILDHLRARFPASRIVHAFASTEAGVAFEVTDRIAGFPATLIPRPNPRVEMRVEAGTLRIRSERTARHYLGPDAPPLKDAEGFVNTGDQVERDGDRYYFVGRQDGMINVGGLKVHPEEVEGVINRHPLVQMSRVKARNNPITGAVVAADVVAGIDAGTASGSQDSTTLRAEILQACRAALPPYKVPAVIRFVDSLAVTPAGKVARGAP